VTPAPQASLRPPRCPTASPALEVPRGWPDRRRRPRRPGGRRRCGLRLGESAFAVALHDAAGAATKLGWASTPALGAPRRHPPESQNFALRLRLNQRSSAWRRRHARPHSPAGRQDEATEPRVAQPWPSAREGLADALGGGTVSARGRGYGRLSRRRGLSDARLACRCSWLGLCW